MKILTLLLLIGLQFGCAAKGPRYSETNFHKTEGMAEVYVFRLNKFTGGGGCIEIRIDDEVIGDLANGGFIRKEVTPGNHIASMPATPTDILKLNVNASQDKPTYIQYSVALNGEGIEESQIISEKKLHINKSGELMRFHNLFVEVKPEYAMESLKTLKDSSVNRSCLGVLRPKK
jgi:hypothetical protein